MRGLVDAAYNFKKPTGMTESPPYCAFTSSQTIFEI